MSTLLTTVRLGATADLATMLSGNTSFVSVRNDHMSLGALLEQFPYPCDMDLSGLSADLDQHLVSLLDGTGPAWSVIADVLVLSVREIPILEKACTGWTVAVVVRSNSPARVITRMGWSADLICAAGSRIRIGMLSSYGSFIHDWHLTGRRLEELNNAVLSVEGDHHYIRSPSVLGCSKSHGISSADSRSAI